MPENKTIITFAPSNVDYHAIWISDNDNIVRVLRVFDFNIKTDPNAAVSVEVTADIVLAAFGYAYALSAECHELIDLRQATANQLDLRPGERLTDLPQAAARMKAHISTLADELNREMMRKEQATAQLEKALASQRELEVKVTKLETLNLRQQIALLNLLKA